jgi:hypothetical protein
MLVEEYVPAFTVQKKNLDKIILFYIKNSLKVLGSKKRGKSQINNFLKNI